MVLMAVGVSAQTTTTLVTEPEFETPVGQALIVKAQRFDPFPVEPGSYVDVWIRADNFGSKDIDNFKFRLTPRYPFTLDPNEQAERDFGLLRAGERATFKYKVRVDVNAVQGENPLEYEYILRGSRWLPGQFNIDVTTLAAILYVKEVTTDTVAPGATSTIGITLKNLADSAVKDVRVKLNFVEFIDTPAGIEVREVPLSPVGSSDEKAVKLIQGQEQLTLNFDVIVDPSTDAGVFKLPLSISYNDLQGVNYSRNNFVGFVIGSGPELVVNLDSSTANRAETKGEVVMRLVNRGLSELKFVYVTLGQLDDFELLSPAQVYLGNIDSDDYETAVYQLYVKKGVQGEIELPLTVEYRDASNKPYQESMQLTIRVYSDKEAKEFGLVKKSKVVGIVIVLIIVVGGFFVYRKLRKKAKRKG